MKTNQIVPAPVGEFVAHTLAPQANQLAGQARMLQETYHAGRAWIERFDQHWQERHLAIYFICCAGGAIASFFLGIEMYHTILTDSYFKTSEEGAPLAAVMLISLFFTSLSLYTGHLAARVFNGRYCEWLEKNELLGGAPLAVIRYQMDQERTDAHLKFAAMILFTFGVSVMITYQRFVYMNSASILQFAMLLLPIVTYIVEVITGEMAVLFLRRIYCKWEKEHVYRRFKALMLQTAALDKKVASGWRDAIRNGESPQILADVRQCIYRTKNRGTDHDDYVDICPESSFAVAQSELAFER